MKKYLVYVLFVIIFILGFVLAPKEKEDKKLNELVENISWLQTQLSGLKTERAELEKQQTNLTKKWDELRKEIKKLETQKEWLEVYMGLKKASQPEVATWNLIQSVTKLISWQEMTWY